RRAIEAGPLQRAIQQLAGRPDERMPTEIFLVAGLLADEHQRRGSWTFAEDGLRAALVEVTRLAPGGRRPHRGQSRSSRNQVSGRAPLAHSRRRPANSVAAPPSWREPSRCPAEPSSNPRPSTPPAMRRSPRPTPRAAATPSPPTRPP